MIYEIEADISAEDANAFLQTFDATLNSGEHGWRYNYEMEKIEEKIALLPAQKVNHE